MDLGGLGPQFVGPLVLASLAYPEEKYADLRTTTAFRLAGRPMVDAGAAAGAWFKTEGGAALPLDVKALYGGTKQFDGRIRKRIAAGWMALKPLLALERGEPPLRTWGKNWNQSAEIRKACEELGIANSKNFQNRHWYPSMPVIHLAAAWAEFRAAARMRGEPPDDGLQMLTDQVYLFALLRRAGQMEDLVDRSALPVAADQLIRFRGKVGSVLI